MLKMIFYSLFPTREIIYTAGCSNNKHSDVKVLNGTCPCQIRGTREINRVKKLGYKKTYNNFGIFDQYTVWIKGFSKIIEYHTFGR